MYNVENAIKNSLAIFRLSTGMFEEMEVNSNCYFCFRLFINGKSVIEI